MSTPIRRNAYTINPEFEQFLNSEVIPLTGINPENFWDEFIRLIDDFAPENRRLLAVRDEMQASIDQWHQSNNTQPHDAEKYKAFLTELGYLVADPEPFQISPENIDAEIATTAGPQLVVPVKNARFALNAANARWGSLYDALYGTDVVPDKGPISRGESYNELRGERVIAMAKNLLDELFPLEHGSHAEVSSYSIYFSDLMVQLADGRRVSLANRDQFVAYNGEKDAPAAVVLENNRLRAELVLNPQGANGQTDPANLDDVLLESAITTIMDCEDSVAAVDCKDKLEVYRNWLGLTQGDLTATFGKGEQKVVRSLREDRLYTSKEGEQYLLPGRSLQLVRNVGLHMFTDMVLDEKGQEIPEGIVDAVVTVAVASLDLQDGRPFKNSRTGSIYVVKPKLHGPEEAGFTCQLFDRVEEILRLPRNTVKLGIMDEERRTSVNLVSCISAARERIAFINTGFLDRTGDEIHTSMHAGAFLPKDQIKAQRWFGCYEDNNVLAGLACGFSGRAQIGKGMWPKPDAMKAMLDQKVGHPKAGASTAWVPSPTAATLHALHYHRVSVASVQEQLRQMKSHSIDPMLDIPLIPEATQLTSGEIEQELENNIQGLLGYVVHWINSGTGCSKIPDIHNEGLMEDRATLRISSQHIANWLLHEICSEQQVEETLQRMAHIVDKQNVAGTSYVSLADNLENSLAFAAARELIFGGVKQANGYTEPTLHKFRKQFKASGAETPVAGAVNK